jgi:chromosome partitioning protein
MKRITVAMAKGGVGKTTIAAALAVRAAKESKRVAMVDLNGDQGNLTQWWQLRGEPKNPQLFSDLEDIVADLDAIEADGWQFCVIDTPPGYSDLVRFAVFVSDVVIIPIKASIFDAASIQPVIEQCREYGKPFALIMSDVDGKFRTLNAEVMAGLKDEGLLENVKVSHLQAYASAPNVGKTGAEIDGKAAKEIDLLWDTAMLYADMAPARRRARSHGRR